ncbi:MAG: TrkA family potassium uptake protein [Spirochaetae bacterium HGW-Spirochaetae-3]|nr:MAG: TrkA family potassium uptake protein [Spirochaetae bacterium HGW-Spirochaetae-3]
MSRKRNFAVIGLGAFGASICDVLMGKGANVVAMDRDPAIVEQIKASVSAALLVDTTNEDSLLRAPLEDIDVAIVALGDNLEASILTTMLLKQRGIPYVVARAVSPLHASVLRRIGANEVINVEEETGRRVARRLVAPDVLDSLPLSADVSLNECLTPKFFIGKTAAELELEAKLHLRLVAIARVAVDLDDSGNGIRHERLLFPDDTTIIEEADRLFLLGSNAAHDEFLNI